MAVGEFVWIGLLPLLPNVYDAGTQALGQLAHLHILQAVVQSSLCGLLRHLLLKRPALFSCPQATIAASTASRSVASCSVASSGSGQSKVGAAIFLPLFLAEAVFFLLSGFALGTAFPETIPDQRLSLYVPTILLVIPPTIGLLLDKSRRGIALVVFLVLSTVFCIALAAKPVGHTDSFLPLFYLGRDVLVLLFWFITLRLAAKHPFFPVLAVLVLSLNGVSYLGKWLANLVPPGLTDTTAFGLALGFAALVALLCRNLGQKAAQEALYAPSSPPFPADAPDEGFAPDPARREKIFAERGLTDREKEVAALLIQGMSSREMAKTLFLSDNTVNTHIKSILRKFTVSGRKAFLALFTQ